ncbi:Aste57867_18418 [Aphanomyces stellatus]|uniref:Aste57867_18418 protein n=1 Tax=Aphanomyces stellatus TaxID=120398 RepID=A0A485LDS4_9STRA|nr:hypothetical protein As57867_018356 [Aphanomyces stellatus]VFT95154.1 Aste57867_18418 [Aphanomyces stellatus]
MGKTAATAAKQGVVDHEDPELLELKMKKRLYIRSKMRHYRSEEKNEVLALKKKIFDLENDVLRATKPNEFRLRAQAAAGARKGPEILPWKDVAIALREDRSLSEFQNHALKKQVDEYCLMVECMQRWVGSATHMQNVLHPATKSWRNVSLLSNPAARRMGKDWITKQLYYNTNDIFRFYQFPNDEAVPTSDFVVNDIVFSETCFDTVHCRQMLVNIPIERLQQALHGRNFWALFMDGVLGAAEVEAQDKINLIHHHAMTVRHEHANLLSREFLDDDRSVFVGQQIHEDENLPTHERQRNRRFWVELQRVGPHQTRMRNLYVISQSFTSRGYIPLEEEARYWGCDLSTTRDVDREDVFKRRASVVIWKQYNAGNQKLQQSVFGDALK